MAQTTIVLRVDAAAHQMSADDTVVLDLSSGQYYLLEGVASRVWQLLDERPCTFEELSQVIVSEHDVTPESCHRDLVAFVGDLAAAGLVEIKTHE